MQNPYAGHDVQKYGSTDPTTKTNRSNEFTRLWTIVYITPVTRAVERYQESDLYLEGPESIRSVIPPTPAVPSLDTPLSPPAALREPPRGE